MPEIIFKYPERIKKNKLNLLLLINTNFNTKNPSITYKKFKEYQSKKECMKALELDIFNLEKILFGKIIKKYKNGEQCIQKEKLHLML